MSQNQFTLLFGMISVLFLAGCSSPQSNTNFEANRFLPRTQTASALENEQINSNISITDEEEEIYLPLIVNNRSSTDVGYNLFSPLGDTATYLIDEDGETVFTWNSTYRPGNAVYLLENGNLLRTGNTNSANFNAGGVGGIVEEIDVDSNIIWSYEHDTAQGRLHHDIEQLPDGNILMLAWELKTESEFLAAGRKSNLLSDGELWPDTVIEVDPDTNSIVWEWHVWDHLVQDFDSNKANYGVVADHPELIDINYRGTGAKTGSADWNHMNSVDYNEEFDQILLSVRGFSEIWIIDHSTTTAEASSHSGGNGGMGGDLLYRWGNPQAYDGGNANDQQLFVQHDAQWIPDGYSGAGNILLFNNGSGRSDGDYSTINEIVPPVDGSGNYSGYGPTAPVWTYTAVTPTDFYATNISGVQRLPNGNTLICDGPSGYFFEVTDAGEIVWEYDHGNQAIFRVTRYDSSYAGLPSFN
ncbi:MAG: arylsulfotransferase [Chloroflexi bacterium]|nr:arylsulfotransferase [Chloroflexota bacterium]